MPSTPAIQNSTNVRERTGRAIGVTLALWAGLVASAAAEGVFAKLETEAVAALAAFTLAYSLSMYFLDAPLRAYARNAARVPLVAAAWAALAALALLAWFSAGGTHNAALLAQWPGALAALFAAPIALVATAAAIERAAALRLSAGKRPAARQAAT